MSFISWLRSGKQATHGRGWQHVASRSRQGLSPRRRPRLEALEDRCLLSGGVLDPTFGTGGVVSNVVGTGGDAEAVAIYSNPGTANDGKIVVAG